jgi:isopenicillin N synthase-like dioxygenase
LQSNIHKILHNNFRYMRHRLRLRYPHNSELSMVIGVSSTDEAVRRIAQDGYAFLGASDELQVLLQEALDAGDEFFQLDADQKTRNGLPLDTGYRPFGQEYSKSSTHPDEVESFTVSYRVPYPERQLSSVAARMLHARMLAVFDVFEAVAEEITSKLALCFNDRPKDLKGAFGRWSLLQFNYSRPSLTNAAFINDVHEDGCLLTIMSIAGSGLELQSGPEFTPVVAAKQQVLVMAGEILWLLTGGEINPVYHRVRAIPSCSTRKSVLFFADMNPAVCDPWIINHVNQDIDIGKKVLQNSSRFGLSEWVSDV